MVLNSLNLIRRRFSLVQYYCTFCPATCLCADAGLCANEASVEKSCKDKRRGGG